ncbi:MAG: lysylphosphatidylglycerol synthase transmembrane domain-containing protein [Candidatus Bathyarchaeia archaeon]
MIAGLAVFVFYLYFFIGSPQILLVLRNINPAQYALYYSLAILAVLASVFCWSAAWNSILRELSIKISYKKSYLYYWVGNFADLIVPCATVCGEITRLYLVQKETNENYGAIAASSVTNRIVAYSVVTTGLAAGSIFVLSKANVPPMIVNLFILLVVGAAAYLAVLLFLAFYEGAAEIFGKLYFKVISRIRPNKNSPEDQKKIQETLSSFYQGFRVFRENPRGLAKPFVFHIAAYVLGLSVYVFVFYALGIPASSPVFYIVVYFVATAFQDAIASFSVGSLDILLATIFILYGINAGTSGIAAIIVRTASFWFPLFVSFMCVQIMGAKNLFAVKPKDMRNALEERRLPDKPIILLEQHAPEPIAKETRVLGEQQIPSAQIPTCPTLPQPVLGSQPQVSED